MGGGVQDDGVVVVCFVASSITSICLFICVNRCHEFASTTLEDVLLLLLPCTLKLLLETDRFLGWLRLTSLDLFVLEGNGDALGFPMRSEMSDDTI